MDEINKVDDDDFFYVSMNFKYRNSKKLIFKMCHHWGEIVYMKIPIDFTLNQMFQYFFSIKKISNNKKKILLFYITPK